MNFVKRMKELTPRRWAGMILGTLIMSIGIAVLKWSHTGNDPFAAMVMSLAENVFHVRYGLVLIITNCFIFLIEILLGRKYIGPGTVVNWFLLGPVVDFVYPFMVRIGLPHVLWQNLILSILGVVIIAFSCSVYQTSDAGISPYDSLAVIGDEKTNVPYFWWRIGCEAVCAFVCFVTGGVMGIGMILCVFGLGPIISFFDKNFSRPVILGK